MILLDGKNLALSLQGELRNLVAKQKQDGNPAPGLAVVLIGEDPASQVYVRNKEKACQEAGLNSWVHRLPGSVSKDQVKKLITDLNQKKEVHGILVQLPLPKSLDENEVLSWINPQKDPDCLTVENLGLLFLNRPRVTPCTPTGVMKILEHYKIPVEGQKAVVIGRSAIVGKPMSLLLQAANATVTVCHSHTKDLKHHTQDADVLVVAAGKPHLIGKEHVKKGAVVIDVGIHRVTKPDGGSQLVGDVRFAELKDWASAITPVPGGVGPMTIAMLIQNTITLSK